MPLYHYVFAKRLLFHITNLGKEVPRLKWNPDFWQTVAKYTFLICRYFKYQIRWIFFFNFLHLNWLQVNFLELLGLLVPEMAMMTSRRNQQDWQCWWRNALDPSFVSRKPCSVIHLLSTSQRSACLFYLEDTKCIFSVDIQLCRTRDAGEVTTCWGNALPKWVVKTSGSFHLLHL